MKLKYYLRGLAVGIILTTLILTITGSAGKNMSDAKIRQRAYELGMVDANSAKLTDVVDVDPGKASEAPDNSKSEEASKPSESTKSGEASKPSESAKSEEASKPSESTRSEEVSKSSESTKSEDASKSSEGTKSEEASKSSESTKSEEASKSSESTNGGGTTGGDIIRFTIKSGDSSYTVAKGLAELGLVEDAVKYDKYLCDNGYSRTIRVGTYELTIMMTEEEIAKKIAG